MCVWFVFQQAAVDRSGRDEGDADGLVQGGCRECLSSLTTACTDRRLPWRPLLCLLVPRDAPAALRCLFQDHFLNAANWMWLSATAFFNQYYRVYSPVTFGKKYDPEGRFIRRFVPQLAQFPSKYIYEPHMAPREVQQR